MKKYTKLGLLIILIAMTFSLTSCIDYQESPVDNAEDTSVISFYYTIYPNQWVPTNEPAHWYTKLNVPEITEDVLDYGAVLVYTKNNLNSWVLLPFSSTFNAENNNTYTEEIWAGHYWKGIDIDYKYTNKMNPTVPGSPLSLRVVIIRDWNIYDLMKMPEVKDIDLLMKKLNKPDPAD